MERYKIVLHGAPLSTGSIYKSHCRFGYPTVYMTTDGKNLKESYQDQASAQWKKLPIQGAVGVAIKLFRQKNIGDIDNHNKILFDSLNGIVWKDDRQITRLEIDKMTDREEPRIELEIWKINEEEK